MDVKGDFLRDEDAPWMVAAWIGAAYWFTASTSFANPAITIARSLSDTFASKLDSLVDQFSLPMSLETYEAIGGWDVAGILAAVSDPREA